MASTKVMSRLSSCGGLQATVRPQTQIQLLPFLVPFVSLRQASGKSLSAKGKGGKKDDSKNKKKKKGRVDFFRQDPKSVPLAQQFSLCDAMRYLRAFEVGQKLDSSKYELAIALKTNKNGPVVRNRMRLPHAVDTSQRIAVICPPDSAAAQAAHKAGAVLVGEENIFEAVREGRINFERLLCHPDSAQKLSKAALGRVLGPKGLMPSQKTNTIVKDISAAVQNMVGATEYREKLGVIRLAIGQLGFSPEQMQTNIKILMAAIKADMGRLSDNVSKEIHEVVLSSTNGPGLPLNGDFRSEGSLPSQALTGS